jgi:hypothetical protein
VNRDRRGRYLLITLSNPILVLGEVRDTVSDAGEPFLRTVSQDWNLGGIPRLSNRVNDEGDEEKKRCVEEDACQGDFSYNVSQDSHGEFHDLQTIKHNYIQRG